MEQLENLDYFASLFNMGYCILENNQFTYINDSNDDISFIAKNENVRNIFIDFPNHVYPYVISINKKYSFTMFYSKETKIIIGPFAIIEDMYVKNSFDNVYIHHEQNAIPRMSVDSIMLLMLGLNYAINKTKLPKDKFFIRNFVNDKVEQKISSSVTEFIYKNNEANKGHHPNSLMANLERCVENGDTVLLLSAIQDFFKNANTSVLSPDELRNVKDLSIVGITVCTRSGIKAGLHYELCFSLSDVYIQEIEKCQTVKEVQEIYVSYTMKITSLVKEHKKERKDKKNEVNSYVSDAKKYISRHLTEVINVDDIANAIGVSPNYLSSMFKKSQDITLTKYVQTEKVRLAKRLLLDSNMTQADVASSLAFSSQSHFCGVFKEITGITPKEYIKEALRLRNDE